jgi:MSHA biogenesis protein MshO
MSMPRPKGFTLLEMVISIVIGSIILVFLSMFIIAPVDAYAAHNQRAVLVSNASTAWPRMEADIRRALPNSVRWRRNGNIVVLEMLNTLGFARYSTPPNTASFTVAGTASGVFGSYAAGATLNGVHLSVNNAGQEAYTQTASMTPTLNNVQLVANATAGEAQVQLAAPQAALNINSPRNRVYLVNVPITYLCNEPQGTLTRYVGYPIAALQTSRDTPAELGGSTSSEVVARGLAACRFDTTSAPGRPQNVAVQLTSTRASESVVLLHTATVENLQ